MVANRMYFSAARAYVFQQQITTKEIETVFLNWCLGEFQNKEKKIVVTKMQYGDLLLYRADAYHRDGWKSLGNIIPVIVPLTQRQRQQRKKEIQALRKLQSVIDVSTDAYGKSCIFSSSKLPTKVVKFITGEKLPEKYSKAVLIPEESCESWFGWEKTETVIDALRGESRLGGWHLWTPNLFK